MEIELKQEISKILNEYKRIDFRVIHHHKGPYIDIEFGVKKNNECGEIYEKLAWWLGYGDFCEFLVSSDTFYDFFGWIEFENEEIVLNVIFNGPYEGEFETIQFEFESNFLESELLISSFIESIPDFKNDCVSVCFDMEKGGEFETKYFCYYDGSTDVEIELNQSQINILKKYIIEVINGRIPTLLIGFPCEQIWSVDCYENVLKFEIKTSPIKLKLNDIISEQDR